MVSKRERLIYNEYSVLSIIFAMTFLVQFSVALSEYFSSPNSFAPYYGVQALLIFVLIYLLPAVVIFFAVLETEHAELVSLLASLFLFADGIYVMRGLGTLQQVMQLIEESQFMQINSLSSALAGAGLVFYAMLYILSFFIYFFAGYFVGMRVEIIEQIERKEAMRRKENA